MNDKCEGALEALAWVQSLLERSLAMGVDMKTVKTEVDLMKEKFLNGLADSFEP